MNRALIKRLINEYLDGEIGLADKVELERLMAEDPAVRREYKELRQIGLLLGGIPEIKPHPAAFRARLNHAIDERGRPFFTPQRTFAGAMVVALVVITLSFGMLMYQEQMLRAQPNVPSAAPATDTTPGMDVVTLDCGTDAGSYLGRLMVEHDLGMVSPEALTAFSTQTTVLEGAVCTGDMMNPVKLAVETRALQLRVSPNIAIQLSKVAEELSGKPVALSVYSGQHARVPLEEYLRSNPGQNTVNLYMKFR